ncbi:hypothetical protein V6N12_069565 [Hibiscus sabdariffa]|uniref:Uncharacterized protein n=1 Tax=Hibiscus sabdariffa TaxID=183260 RepID=A0ABR2FE80_9ROSI
MFSSVMIKTIHTTHPAQIISIRALLCRSVPRTLPTEPPSPSTNCPPVEPGSYINYVVLLTKTNPSTVGTLRECSNRWKLVIAKGCFFFSGFGFFVFSDGGLKTLYRDICMQLWGFATPSMSLSTYGTHSSGPSDDNSLFIPDEWCHSSALSTG